LIFFWGSVAAQDLDPRAYIRVPVNSTTLITGFSYSYGGVVTDATLPIKDVKAHVATPSLALLRTFSLFGLTSQALVALPYSWADGSGLINGQPNQIDRMGFSDMRLRFTVLLHGAPAASLAQIVKAPRRTIVGASLNIVAPVGQYFPDKLVNLGANRWSFRPEIGLSQPLGKRWLLDLYSGVWFFTNNPSFYPGNLVRSQNSLGAFQMHLSYNLKNKMWFALDATHYIGGNSKVGEIWKEDRQANSRIGATVVMPVWKMFSLKLAASTGAIVRSGQDFTTFSMGWQTTWFSKEDRAFLNRKK
jgi:hypothetical protein